MVASLATCVTSESLHIARAILLVGSATDRSGQSAHDAQCLRPHVASDSIGTTSQTRRAARSPRVQASTTDWLASHVCRAGNLLSQGPLVELGAAKTPRFDGLEVDHDTAPGREARSALWCARPEARHDPSRAESRALHAATTSCKTKRSRLLTNSSQAGFSQCSLNAIVVKLLTSHVAFFLRPRYR